MATLLLAIWGAVLSTILALIRIVEFLKDRPEVKVWVSGGFKIYPPIGEYANMDLIHISVVNTGRRPITISGAGLVYPRGTAHRYTIAQDSIQNVELTEGRTHSYFIDEKKALEYGQKSEKYVAFAQASTGKKYYSHGMLKRFWRLRRLR